MTQVFQGHAGIGDEVTGEALVITFPRATIWTGSKAFSRDLSTSFMGRAMTVKS